MIHVAVRFDEGLSEMTMSGHDGPTANREVCAAASAIFQTAVLGLREIAFLHPGDAEIEISH